MPTLLRRASLSALCTRLKINNCPFLFCFQKWRRYWFILIEDPQQVGLVCFLTEKDFIARSKHKGFIRLDDSEALNVLKDQQPCYNNSLEIIKKGARYVLGAETRYGCLLVCLSCSLACITAEHSHWLLDTAN